MLSFWNRRELLCTFSLRSQAEAREALAGAGIPYLVKTSSRGGSGLFGSRRGCAGALGEDAELSYEYRIFVRKEDWERAAALCRCAGGGR